MSLSIFTLAEMVLTNPHSYSFENMDTSVKESFLVWIFMLFMNILETQFTDLSRPQ